MMNRYCATIVYVEGTFPNQIQFDICDGKNDPWDTWEQEVLQSDRR